MKFFSNDNKNIFESNWELGFYEFYGKNWEGEYGKKVKSHIRPLKVIRKSMVHSKDFDDPVSAGIMENHFPHGASLKTLSHLGNMIDKGLTTIEYFDWNDEVLNRELYGSPKPPSIDIYSPNKIPMIIYAGVQDKIVNIVDVREVVDRFNGNLKYFKEIDGDHLSYFIGKDMTYVDDLIEQIAL